MTGGGSTALPGTGGDGTLTRSVLQTIGNGLNCGDLFFC